ncbi:MAG: hypothetical protein IPL53_23355 [Ignavibacteria bacterium]|nr:hypothetical protein [Ignavibacteria bacterium]
MLKSIIGIIIFGAAFRSILFIANGSKELESMFILILTPSCMDSFGLGALLAYCKIFEKFRYIFSSKISAIFYF